MELPFPRVWAFSFASRAGERHLCGWPPSPVHPYCRPGFRELDGPEAALDSGSSALQRVGVSLILLTAILGVPAPASAATGTTTRASVDSDGSQANDFSEFPAVSDDGRYIAFESFASNLVPGDTNGLWDVFVHDRDTGFMERLSVATDGTQANSHSGRAGASPTAATWPSTRVRATWCRVTPTASRTCSCVTARRGAPNGSASPATAAQANSTKHRALDQRRRPLRRLRRMRATWCRATPTASPTSSCVTARRGPPSASASASDGAQANGDSLGPCDLRRRPLRGLRVSSRATWCRATPTASDRRLRPRPPDAARPSA